jgi:8-oxo-dGTP pyrophosphatase MutT (NUDIX family)
MGCDYMIRAAGILFVTPNDQVLLMHRVAKAQQDGDIPGVWAFPGGGLEAEESAEDAARREIQEETGVTYEGPLKLWTRRIRDEVDFTTFLARVDEPFVPTMNDEHDAYQWVDRQFAVSSALLHPGVYIALNRFAMDELGVAKAMAAGELTSPQMYNADLMLIALRITGTGVSFRPAHDEYVFRDPAIYMNDEFLERCNGLEVIFRHPKGSLLNSQEYRDRIVGTIFVPYLKHDIQEAWGIAKIRDMDAADLLAKYQMSTSPAVLVLGDKVEVPDGRKILIENKPHLLDHLAILIPETSEDGELTDSGAGVWDRGGPLSGVESVDAQPFIHPEEASSLDVILNTIMSKKIDEISRRADSFA